MHSRMSGAHGRRSEQQRKNPMPGGPLAIGVALALTAGFAPPTLEPPHASRSASSSTASDAAASDSAASGPVEAPAPPTATASAASPSESPSAVRAPAGGAARTAPAASDSASASSTPSPSQSTPGARRPPAGLTPARNVTAVRPAPPLKVGSITIDAVTGRKQTVVAAVHRTAVLIGDSQSSRPESWPQLALRTLGYDVHFAGVGGTGYVAANQSIGAPNYLDSFAGNVWALPHGDPSLVVVAGGGNDAATGASDAAILANAEALLAGLEREYPSSRFLMIGTLSRSTEDGGGRRHEVDALLGGLAAKKGIPFVSPGDWLTVHGLEDNLADDVHLSAEGDRRAAGILLGELQALDLDVVTAVRPERSHREQQRVD